MSIQSRPDLEELFKPEPSKLGEAVKNLGSPLRTYCQEGMLEAGVDEAGRGPALGRVYAAAVIWPANLHSPLVRDSKKIPHKAMKTAYDFVIANAIDYSIAYASESEIDRYNILQADMLAMHRAVDGLRLIPGHLLVDGDYFKIYQDRDGEFVNYSTVIQGDNTYYSIAAASILAKYSRDSYIEELCDTYPALDERYGLRGNKGYVGAARHKEGIERYGVSQFHRLSFRCCQGRPINPVKEKEPEHGA
jgi:ribonuclease HII